MKKFLAILCALVLCLSVFSAVAETVKASQPWKIALITMDSIDQHWVKLNEGAQAKAAELGVTVDFMSPNTKDDAQQIEAVNNAVAKGYNAILVAANGPDAISGALKEAQARPEESAFIGDNLTRDIIGAKASNFGSTIAVEYPDAKKLKLTRENQPDGIITRFDQLLEVFPQAPVINRSAMEQRSVE